MMWLEMSRNELHGGKGWAFTECLWAPSHKHREGPLPYWESLLQVQKDDVVFHLRGRGHHTEFVGYSIADSNGYETENAPPLPGELDEAESYYRVPLREFASFPDPISLDAIFKERNDELRAYFNSNQSLPWLKRENIFFAVLSNRIQCVSKAYCSQVSDTLAGILFGPDLSQLEDDTRPEAISPRTGLQIRQICSRVEHINMTEMALINYNNHCCFPDCEIDERRLLTGTQIAKWVDAPELRGKVANCLCFCPIHDKAFEAGMFTLTSDFRISTNINLKIDSLWIHLNLKPHEGKQIRLGQITPSTDALKKHWERIHYTPE